MTFYEVITINAQIEHFCFRDKFRISATAVVDITISVTEDNDGKKQV
jgi:hypothetical protein